MHVFLSTKRKVCKLYVQSFLWLKKIEIHYICHLFLFVDPLSHGHKVVVHMDVKINK
jgi:hypothetical protein